MASIAVRVRLRSARVSVRQLALAWAIGSVIMGTVVVIFQAFPPEAYVFQLNAPVRLSFPLPPGVLPRNVDAPIAGLPVPARLAVLALVGLLFVALGVLARYTGQSSWLPTSARGWVLWALVTGAIGLTGWLFAATVTFGAGFGPLWQAVLAYTAGGLPFALAAGLLQSSWLVNLGALGVSVGLVAAGFVLVAAKSRYEPNALSLFADYVRYLFSSVPVQMTAPIPVRSIGGHGG